MCLYKIRKEPGFLIAKRDIKIYKVLYEFKGQYFSPYHNMEYVPNVEYSSDLVEIKTNEKYFTVRNGLHSYGQLRDLKRMHKGESYVIFKGIIPKGSRYARGTFGDIVSDKLIITEIHNI